MSATPMFTGRPSGQAVARVLLVPYSLALALIVFLPAHEAGRVTGIVGWAADLVATWGVPREPAAVVFEFVANIVLFMPLGVLTMIAVPRWSPWTTVGLGCVVSIFVEAVQLGIPSRVPTAWDVLANTAGTALGCGAVLWWRRRRSPADDVAHRAAV